MKKNLGNAFHILLLVIFIFNTIVPTPAVAQTITPPPPTTGVDEPSERTLPVLPPVYYTPQKMSQPVFGPAPEIMRGPKSPEHHTKALEFHIQAESNVVDLNQAVLLTVTIQNNSGTTLKNLQFTDFLLNGFTYVAGSCTGCTSATYNSQKKIVGYTIKTLGAGKTVSFSYKVKSTLRKQKSTQGELQIHTAVLNQENGQKVYAQVPFLVGSSIHQQGYIAAYQTKGGWHKLGRVSVHLAERTVGANSILVAIPLEGKRKLSGKGQKAGGPAMQFELKIIKTGPLTKDSLGIAAAEQAAAIESEEEIPFEDPAYLEIDLTGMIDLQEIPAGKIVYVATYDEENEVWVQVPIVDKNAETNTVTVMTNHFSGWGAGLGDALPQNGAQVLLFDQPYTSLFTGSARYSLPVWMPAGRAGMSPSVSLSYSSATVDGVLGDVQAPWVGTGWNMDSIEVVRRITTSDNTFGYVNDFTLSLNGASYPLVPDEGHPGRYLVKQDGFLYIQRHNCALKNNTSCADNGGTLSANNKTGEYWEVVTTNGRRYEMGNTLDSEQLALMYGYTCTNGGLTCNVPSGAYGPLGYAGIAKGLVALRWRVNRIRDTHGNYMDYTYDEYQPDNGVTFNFDRASYLKSIDYTGFDDGITSLSPKYHIKFFTINRPADVPYTFNAFDNFDQRVLDRIEIRYNSTIVRTYNFGYDAAGNSLVMKWMQITGGGFTSSTAGLIPTTNGARVDFDYAVLPNRAPYNSNDVFNYPRLSSIDNGYGGKLTYTYESDGHTGPNGKSWYNYRVKQATVDSGLGVAAVRGYLYENPLYGDLDTDDDHLGALTGYTTTTESILNPANPSITLQKTKHSFATTEPDTGKELVTSVMDSADVILRQTVSAYVTDNSKASFPGWTYRYLGQTENYQRQNNALQLVSKTTYTNDPATGNLLLQQDFMGNTLYRKTYYEYITNPDPSVYILDKVSRAVRVDAKNQIFADTRSYYDNSSGATQGELTKGDLIIARTLTGEGNATVDTFTSYNDYGLPILTRSYINPGTLGTNLSGSFIENKTDYDSTMQQYPIKSYNGLDQFTQTDYIYEMGIPYKTTDLNGWVSTSTFDGLGRKRSVTPPGLSQPGMWFTYPALTNGKVQAPYAVQMQIFDQPAATYRAVWGIYDGMGRILQNQVYNAGTGKLAVTDTTFNGFGSVEYQGMTHQETGVGGMYIEPDWAHIKKTITSYDALGRAIQVIAPGGFISTTEYNGLITRTIDPKHQLVKSTTDGLGRMVTVQEYTGTTDTSNVLYTTTEYTYDAADRLLNVKDNDNNVTVLSYNWLGQKIGMRDPDMGTWTYLYDALGGMTEQTDARGCTTTLDYLRGPAFQYPDKLHRLTRKTFSGTLAECDDTHDIIYTYEDSMPGQIGMRTGMSDGSGETSWSYANYGRTVTETRTIGLSNGVTKTFTNTSDWLGRALTVQNPDGEIISYTYDAMGQPEKLTSSDHPGKPLVELAYDVLGRITETTLGNDVIVSNTYDSSTMRLTSRTANKESTELMDFNYQAYDDNGNITRIFDGMRGETIDYEYDELNRLKSAVAQAGASNTIYNQAFEYDPLGNILSVNNLELPTALPTNTASPTNTPTHTATKTPTQQQGMLPAGNLFNVSYHLPVQNQQASTATFTPTVTQTPSKTLTPTITPTAVSTNTLQITPTSSKTLTATPMTLTATRTLTPTKTKTPTATATNTQNAYLSMMGYWSFSSNTGNSVPDDSSKNHPGSIGGNAAIVNDDQPYLYFDGTRGWMEITRDSELDHLHGFTLSARFDYEKSFLTGTATPSSGAVAKLISVDDNTYLSLRNGYLEFYTTSLSNTTLQGPKLTANGWNTVTVTYDSVNGAVRMYVNGIEAASQRAYGTIGAYGTQMIVGDKAAAAMMRYQGSIDDVRFYNRPLSDTEIAYMANSQATPTVAANRPTSSRTPTPTRTHTRTKTATSTAGPSPTFTPTLLPENANLPWGTGNDGPLSVATATEFNINLHTNGYNGRTCADGISYLVTQVYGNTAVVSQNPAAGCLMLNDEVILINLQGTTLGSANTGKYEFLRVMSVEGNKVIFNRLKTNFYGMNAFDDNYIGTGGGTQKVILQRVPNYSNVSVAGSLTNQAWFWNTAQSGVLALRASGTVSGSGSITMTGKGFNGGEGGPVGADDDGRPGAGYAAALDGSAPGGYGGGIAGTGGNPQTVHAGGGGSYGEPGKTDDGITPSGQPYGDAALTRLYLGAGGGGGGETTSNGVGHDGDDGTSGGGIVFLAGNTINFSGQISAKGSNADGAGGAGGSIRVEVNTATALGSLLANGGPRGGAGRIALYATGGTLSGAPYSVPAYQLYNRSTYLTPMPTATPTKIDLSDVYGTGADGDLYIDSGQTFNISTSGKNLDRGCTDGGDAVSYRVIGLTSSSATLHRAIDTSCLTPGDEVLLINLMGDASKYVNTGNYEFLHVGSVDPVTRIVYFTTSKTKAYGEDTNGDANIGMSTGQQMVALVRVPNYNNVTIMGSGVLTTSAFEAPTTTSMKNVGGVIAFRVANILQGEGRIEGRNRGYHGTIACGDGPSGHINAFVGGCNGGGGGYGTVGANGIGTGGPAYGTADLKDKLYFGAGGGGHSSYGIGAPGGGIVYIAAQTVQKKSGDTYSISIYNQGQLGTATGGGSGAGGSLYLRGRSVVIGSLLTGGGTDGTADGGEGRSAVYYESSFTSYNSPGYQEDLTPATATITPTRTSGPSNTPTRTPTSSQATKVSYAYNSYHPHAVTSLSNGNIYTYDANGNMKTRLVDGVSTTFVYDGNNRITSANNASTNEIYWYDGDGNRVAKLVNNTTLTAYFAGGSYEVGATSSGTVTSTTKYYSLGGTTVMDDTPTGAGGTLRYLLTDHQGSTITVLNSSGGAVSHQRYYAFGGIRPDLGGTSQTDFGYTGQRSMSSIGLMDYHARFYDQTIGRFIQPDTIVSNPANSQTWNRYGYVENNPINRIDPTGHESDPWGCNGDHNCIQENTTTTPWRYAQPPKPVICPPRDIVCQLGHERKEKDPLSYLFTLDGYLQGWDTFWNAWSTELNPDFINTPWEMRAAGYAYATAWIALHMTGVGVIIGAIALAHTLIFGATGGCIMFLPGCKEKVVQTTNDVINTVKTSTPWPSAGSGSQIINGIEYSVHALERMSPVGLGGRGMPPSVVENAINYGTQVLSKYDPTAKIFTYENANVVYNFVTNVVITVYKGGG